MSISGADAVEGEERARLVRFGELEVVLTTDWPFRELRGFPARREGE